MKRVMSLFVSIFIFVGCAVQPVIPWQGKEPTQAVPIEQWSKVLADTKSLPGAIVTESKIQTSIKVPGPASGTELYSLYIFTKESSYAHPAAAKMTFLKGPSSAKNPEFNFIKVGDNPNFVKFVREILTAGLLMEPKESTSIEPKK